MKQDAQRRLLHRLCLHFGGECIHPDFLLERLTRRQLEDWIDFDDCEPIGGPADDYRLAQLSLLIAASKGMKKSFNDFLPKWGTPEPLRPEDYKAKRLAAHAQRWGMVQA